MTSGFLGDRCLRKAVLGLLLATGAFSPSALAMADSVEQAYRRFIKMEDAMTDAASSARRDVMAASYAQTMAPRQAASTLSSLSSEDVDLLFRAAYDTAFYTFDRHHVEDMETDLAMLRSRQADRPRHYRDLYEILVRVRDFRAAEKLLAQWPDAIEDRAPAIVGTLVEGLGPSVLVPGKDGASVSQQAVVLGDGIDIVVIGHPHCHFSRDAVTAIEASPSLKALFEHHSRWLMPQDGRMLAKDIAEWNARHPVARMSYIYREQDWPVIDTWATPTFYFFRDGALTDKRVGWGPDGEAALRAALEKLDLP